METARGSAASLTPPGLLVFAGSAERDVAFAKAFWNSVTLQPPLESRLGPAGPRPRETQRNIAFQIPPGNNKSEQIILEAHKAQKAEEKEKYLQKETFAQLKPLCWMNFDSQTIMAPLIVLSLISSELSSPCNLCTLGRCALSQHVQAKRRDEILALLWKQREERITKEQISCLHKPKTKTHQVRAKISDSDIEDQETVKALE